MEIWLLCAINEMELMHSGMVWFVHINWEWILCACISLIRHTVGETKYSNFSLEHQTVMYTYWDHIGWRVEHHNYHGNLTAHDVEWARLTSHSGIQLDMDAQRVIWFSTRQAIQRHLLQCGVTNTISVRVQNRLLWTKCEHVFTIFSTKLPIMRNIFR